MIVETNDTRLQKPFDEHQIPIGRVFLYQTKFTVPSNGIVYRIYDLGSEPTSAPSLYDPYQDELSDDSLDKPILNATTATGPRTHIVLEDWENGVASAISGTYFATAYEGYFYARYTGTYTFKVAGSGGIKFYFDIDTNHAFASTDDADRSAFDMEYPDNLLVDTWTRPVGVTGADSIEHTVTVSLTAGEFYMFRLNYWNKTKIENCISLSYQEPDSDGTSFSSDYLPFAAGSCNPLPTKATENDYFIEPTTVLSVSSMSGNRRQTESAEYAFAVRLSDSTHANSYNETFDQYGPIKKDMLVKFEFGYSTSSYGSMASDDDFITRFIGNITSDIKVTRDEYGATATFSCHDFKNKLINSPNLNYPNNIMYYYNGYLSRSTEGPDGLIKPRIFDRWYVKETVQTLLMISGIDPTLVFYKHKDINVDGSIVPTTQSSIDCQDLLLDARDSYALFGTDFVWPDEYKPLWEFKFGTDSVNDIINEISKNYGFRFLFSSSGVPYLSAINYYTYISSSDSTQGTTLFNNGASEFVYNYLTPDEIAIYNFTGKRFEIIAHREHSAGSIKIEYRTFSDDSWGDWNPVTSIIMDGEIQTHIGGSYSLHSDYDWHVRDGIDPRTGVNSSVISTPLSLDYGEHEIRITAQSFDVYIDGIRSYIINYNSPVRSYSTTNFIGRLDVVNNSSDMINEVIVVGDYQLTGSDPDLNNIPSHIPKATVFSKAVDIRSQIDPTYKYYRGRPVRVIIKEPKITQQDRADWLAWHTLERYRTNAITANFGGPGDPYLEIFDPVTINDEKTKLITSDKTLWVTGFSETLAKGTYTSSVETTPRSPLPSFVKSGDPLDLLDTGDNFVAFEKFNYTGSFTSTGTLVSGQYGDGEFGDSYFGGNDPGNHGAAEFENRIDFDPYAGRGSGTPVEFSWTLLE